MLPFDDDLAKPVMLSIKDPSKRSCGIDTPLLGATDFADILLQGFRLVLVRD